jgi:hypothetical protein
MVDLEAFPELDELLHEFVHALQSIFGPALVGAYLTGSFALGGGDAASDCDFLVVTSGRPSAEQERALRRFHAGVPARPGYWGQNFEGSYAPVGDLQTLAALGSSWLYVDRGGAGMEWSPHCNTEDVRWVLRERAPVLTGADPRTFACPVPAAALQAAMRPQLERFLDDLLGWASFDVSWTQRYAVEASLRMLYTLERGEVISKQDALAWGASTVPGAWSDLIEQVRADRFVRWNDPPRPGSVDQTLEFVAYVQERARSVQS